MDRVVLGFDEIRQNDAEEVGKKCANLGELTSAGFRVPPGFAIALVGYGRFMNETGVRARIEAYLGSFQADPNTTADMPRYQEASDRIRAMVEETQMPADIEAEIRRRYQEMCDAAQHVDLAVATRSAGPASHPGQYESYLHVRGGDAVVDGVRRVWSSTFNQRSLIARARQGLDLTFDPIGVAVLRMVEAKAAGVMFTTNPRDGDAGKVYIEANWGLGESVVSGEVTPDSFLVAKDGEEIIERHICEKQMWFVPDPETGRVGFCQVPDDMKTASALADDELREIARVGVLIERHFGGPQDIEWAVATGVELPESVIFLQTRPQKNIAEKKDATDRLLDFITRDFEF